MAGYTVDEIGAMSLWQFQMVQAGFSQFHGSGEKKEKAPSRNQVEQTYKALGIWYPGIMDDEAGG